jgi:hypothetical protein
VVDGTVLVHPYRFHRASHREDALSCLNHLNHLPIWREANRLLLEVEVAVRNFPRYHKYSLGTELRHQAMEVCRLILRAADRLEVQLPRVQVLVEAVDDLKLQLQLAKGLQGRGWRSPLGRGLRLGARKVDSAVLVHPTGLVF